MLKNVGPADRVVRIIAGAVLAFLVAMGLAEGWFAIVLGVLSAILLVTALTGHCPALKAMGIDTHVHDEEDEKLKI